jgi:hypothetical protein
MLKRAIASAVMMVAAVSVISAQAPGSSPAGVAQVEIGGKYVAGARGGQTYQGGKWMEISYGRPLLRGRDLFAGGPDYGKTLNAGAPVWRAGANQTTRLKTAAAIVIGGKTVPAGEYSVFIDLKENNWTLILSSWAAQTAYDPNNKAALWGAYNYTADKDVARAPMKLMKTTVNVEQLTWGFVNVTATGGEIAFWWGKEMATVPFTLAP